MQVPVSRILGDPDVLINKIFIDSRQVTPNSLFIAQPGSQVDGHRFIPDVINAGVSAIVCENIPENTPSHVTFVQVPDSILYTGIIASNYFENPSSQLKVIGITGTNGKTTIATLLYRLFRRLGYKTGLLSTVINYIDSKSVESTHTTPDAVTIQHLMHKMVANGCTYCFMEVSSHAVVQHRISGIQFSGGIFTNLTHDHLDYHKTFDEYLKAKKQFFDTLPPAAFALTNADDSHGKIMVQNTPAKVSTYSMHSLADFHVRVRESHFDGMLLDINNTEMWTRLIGKFNALKH
jgi:UDP-N-acetylmuramoyl-L-alanyl-D-glutamate--2,6-diaminopimelate ligase